MLFRSKGEDLKDVLNKEENSFKFEIKGDKWAEVYRVNTGKKEKLLVEEYVKGVVAAEMPANFNLEAIKAQAVAARTFYYSKRIENCDIAKGAQICDSTHCQVYQNKDECLKKWKESEREMLWGKINKAVQDTEDEVLVYNNELVKYPQFFSTSSGRTERAVDVFSFDVPYLQSEESLGEEIAPKYNTIISVSIEEFTKITNKNIEGANLSKECIAKQIDIKSNTEGGGVKEIILGNKVISGKEFRKIFNLNSSNFKLEFKGDKININCFGYGHGVGMSQWGANVMAGNGEKYKDILKHYYNGIQIRKVEVSR